MPTPRRISLALGSARGDGEPLAPAAPAEVAALGLELAAPDSGAAQAASGAGGGFSHCDSLEISAEGTLHLAGTQTLHEYNINAGGLKRQVAGSTPRGGSEGGGSAGGSTPGAAQQQQAHGAAGGADEEAVHFRCPADSLVPVGETIGTGVSSHVRVAVHLDTHRLVAVKIISVFDRERRQMVLNEIRTLCESPAAAPGLVDFFGAFYTPASGQLSLVLEYMDGGSLRSLAQAAPNRRLPEQVLRHAARAMAEGLRHLHERHKVVHRDIKPDNVLVGQDGSVKITDFGISAGINPEATAAGMCASFRGTVTYMSPERINSEPYSFPSDVWGLGLSLYELATGQFPYTAGSEGPFQLMLQVMHEASPELPPDHALGHGVTFSAELRDFLAGCLRKEPAQRPTAAQLLVHPWLAHAAAAGPHALELERQQCASFVASVVDPRAQLQRTAALFAEFFYAVYDDEKMCSAQLPRLYSDDSRLSVEGEAAAGGHAAVAMLRDYRAALRVSAGGRAIRHRMRHVDAQPMTATNGGAGGLLVHVQGDVMAQRQGQEEVELAAFAEAFVVGASAGRGGAAWGGGALVVHSQVRRQL